MMWWSSANRFNFMSRCMRERLRRFVVSRFSKVARLNITHCSTEGVLALAFASWRVGVISAHTLPDYALLHLKAQHQPLLIPDSQHSPLSLLASWAGNASCVQLVRECLEHLDILISLLHLAHHSHCCSDCLAWLCKRISK